MPQSIHTQTALCNMDVMSVSCSVQIRKRGIVVAKKDTLYFLCVRQPCVQQILQETTTDSINS